MFIFLSKRTFVRDFVFSEVHTSRASYPQSYPQERCGFTHKLRRRERAFLCENFGNKKIQKVTPAQFSESSRHQEVDR